FAARTSTGIDDLAVRLLRRTKFFAILAVALAATSYTLALGDRVHDRLENVAVIALAIQAALWGSELVSFGLARYAQRQDGVPDGATASTLAALGYVARGLLWVVIVLVALATVGINVTALITGLGVGGVAIALAVQNILGDLFGALSIVLDKPFVVGDTIQVDTFVGTVEHIGLKTTRLRAVSGEQLIFSNADLLKSRIRNFRRQTERRVQFNFTLAPDTATEAVREVPAIVRATVEGVTEPAVRFERAHLTRPTETGLEYELVYHVPTADYTLYLDAQQRITLQLLEQLRAMGVTFSAGTRTVVLRGDAEPRREALAGAAHPAAAPATNGAAAPL
ncbi:MAG: Potassium efflux system KefA protein / Small-conductance mechanosensitive channel, partial [uncultured Gemmatimonadaceae bacterium]